ncbi:hypothetical protein Deipe_1095 [Deinococcus peraridilitoris DSM 19664]|uniref:DUF7878 domain-containing protein n=1 Tax=Deinococcus peraridilitoris (strain DSM 19664 / LMG 22246 / CIP 109416 / KR-200) TaxID=937777 RepID=K9ZYD7_DEIPD|nr:hypothetical protein Deipe_1095 [Deinococcus peraridilitoris DSM 19664]
MVSLPSKKVGFQIGNIEWYNRDYSGSLPNNFEANLKLTRRGMVWFDESATVGELLLQLQDWIAQSCNGRPADFQYHSLDTEDNPIFSVVRDLSTPQLGLSGVLEREKAA